MPRLLVTLCLLLFSLPLPCSAAGTKFCTARPARLRITITGFTRAEAVLPLAAEVSGRVEEILAEVGDTIENNGVFARIDPSLTELELKAKQVMIRQLQRTLDYDSKQVERYRSLLNSKSSSRVRLDELLLKRDQSRLQLEQLQVEVLRLRELLDRHTIRAPAGWRLMERRAEPGQWVAAGTVLARAGDYRQLVVPVALTMDELTSLQAVTKIPLHFPGLGQDGSGTLYRVSPAFDPTSHKVRAEILLDQQTRDRLPLKRGGLETEIRVSVPNPMHAFVVPASAITERYEEHWLTREDGSGIRVIVLGPARVEQKTGDPLIRVTSPQIQAGDRFLLSPAPAP